MKKRISINVQPVDNGYTINCTASDANGQNQKAATLIAKTDDEVGNILDKFVSDVFNPPHEATVATA